MKKIIGILLGAVVLLGVFGCTKKEVQTQTVGHSVKVSVENQITTADIWIIPDTEANRGTSVWGTATVAELGAKQTQTAFVEKSENGDTYLIRIIDENQMYYSADGVVLHENASIVLKEGTEPMSAVVEVYGADGTPEAEYSMFVASL